MSQQNIQARVLEILIEQLTSFTNSCPEVKLEHQLEADLLFDSLDGIEIMVALEDEFFIRINDDEFEKLDTVQQLIDYIAGVCTAKETSGAA